MATTDKTHPVQQRLNRPNKFEARRNTLSSAALAVMGEKGYSETSLRDIASHAKVSVGTLHYYFVNKADLLDHCVKQFKREFIRDMIAQFDTAKTFEELSQNFAENMAETLTLHSHEHRIWFDIRTQALFDPDFIPLRSEMEKELEVAIQGFADTAVRLGATASGLGADTALVLVESLFEKHLFAYIRDSNESDTRLNFTKDILDCCNQLFMVSSVSGGDLQEELTV